MPWCWKLVDATLVITWISLAHFQFHNTRKINFCWRISGALAIFQKFQNFVGAFLVLCTILLAHFRCLDAFADSQRCFHWHEKRHGSSSGTTFSSRWPCFCIPDGRMGVVCRMLVRRLEQRNRCWLEHRSWSMGRPAMELRTIDAWHGFHHGGAHGGLKKI